ncbi:oxidoreductase-like protein [Poronia punctata]|nr:oxidoreductase-like protein [Poronia punctata]
MPLNVRPLMRIAHPQPLWRTSLVQRAFISSGSGTGTLPGGTPGESSEQAMPIGPYYETILVKPQPIPGTKPEEPPTSSPKSPKSPPGTKKAASPKSKANGELAPSTSSISPTASSSPFASSSPSSPPSPLSSSDVSTQSAPQPSAEPASAQEKARIIFGSRLAGPAERADRLQAIRDRSALIAGVLVPPRPEEPDNCCMSGCVNCVWDRYRDDMEDWVSATTRAEAALQAKRVQGSVDAMGNSRAIEGQTLSPQQQKERPNRINVSRSMDDDGGGSETNWQPEELKRKTDHPTIAKNMWDDDLYKNVPVGIREFMKQEKKLKEKHAREHTFGG